MRDSRRLLMMAGIVGLAAVLFAPCAGAVSPILKEIEDAFISIGENVRPCVVNIDVETEIPEGMGQNIEGLEEFFKYFGLPNPQQEGEQERPLMHPMASGSGFIYDKEGHIITNSHVVANAKKVKVRLWNGEVYDVDKANIAADTQTDIAVIKIDTTVDLPVAALGDSNNLKVGQFSIAVGSPRGLEGSFSFGHITALGRDELPLPSKLRFQNFVQTDAAINFGNSGGPLCNIDGEVIGINVAIVYGAESLGFAIPIETAKKVVPSLISQGKVTRGYLGVQINGAEKFAEAEGLPDKNGAYVQGVQPGSVAERAGLKVYDIIRKVNGQVVTNDRDLVTKISDLPPGAKATLEVWRDKAPVNVEVTLGEFPAETDETGLPKEKAVLGLRVKPLTEELIRGLGLEKDAKGVIVSEVESGSAPEEAGIQPGDIIIEIAKQPVASVEEFQKLIKENAKPGQSLLIRVTRAGGMPTVVVIKVPANAVIE